MSYDRNLWNAIKNELSNDNTRKEEMNSKSIKCQNNQSLRFYDKVYGNAGPSGYCLFVCLHGGGQGAPQMNDDQWRNIIPFENNGFKQGTIAVAPRGITNTWNLHFVSEAFPAITRLVENYIIFRNVDPNKVYLMGFSAGGDGTYSLSERIPYLFAACSPQAGHPNGINTVNLCNLPTYLAAGEKDTAFKRNQICVDYYRKILDQNGKYLGNYIAKVEVVAGSGHSFQCWKTPRNSFFNGANKASNSNDTAFTFMYSYTRNPNPTKISCDVKTFLTPLRNYYTQRGNSFYNIELGKNPPDMIQLEINYDNNAINIKEGNNFKLNLNSALFKKGNVVNVNHQGKTQPYQLQKDGNYAKNNMKLYCDPNYGYDSYINIGNYQQEVNLAYVPKPAFVVAPQPQQPKPAPPAPKKNPAPPKIPHHPQPAQHNQAKTNPSQLPHVNQPTRNNHNPAQYIDKGKNGQPYMCVKLAETSFAWSNQDKYWVKKNNGQSLMGKQIFHLNKVFFIDPKAHFYDVPKANYFLLLRHHATNSTGLNTLLLTVKVDGNQIYSSKFFTKNYKMIRNKNLLDQFIMNINANSFKNQDKHEILVQIVGQDCVKKDWDLDGFILIPDNCDGKIEAIYNQYFNNGLLK
jgi:pimeloyl-ACP methyl ester carboxylesterase